MNKWLQSRDIEFFERLMQNLEFFDLLQTRPDHVLIQFSSLFQADGIGKHHIAKDKVRKVPLEEQTNDKYGEVLCLELKPIHLSGQQRLLVQEDRDLQKLLLFYVLLELEQVAADEGDHVDGGLVLELPYLFEHNVLKGDDEAAVPSPADHQCKDAPDQRFDVLALQHFLHQFLSFEKFVQGGAYNFSPRQINHPLLLGLLHLHLQNAALDDLENAHVVQPPQHLQPLPHLLLKPPELQLIAEDHDLDHVELRLLLGEHLDDLVPLGFYGGGGNLVES